MISCDQSFKEVEPAAILGDRRANGRCSIELPMQFQVVSGGPVGTGTVLNMSSTGIAFHTADAIPFDCFVDVSIGWPCPGAARTTFLAYGRVVRKSGELIAMHVLRHQFLQNQPTSPLVCRRSPVRAERD